MTDNTEQFDILSNSESSQINNFIDKIFDNNNDKKLFFEILSKKLENSNDIAYVFYDNVWMSFEEFLKITSTIKNPKTIYQELFEKTLGDYMHKIDISKLSLDKKN